MMTTKHDRLRSLERDDFDVIVIGTGLGGLTAAALLAKRGRSVIAVDHHYVPGGNVTEFRRGRYVFDVGVHYIGDCEGNGLLPRILRAAGAKPIQFRELDPDQIDRFHFPDFVFDFPRGIVRYEDRLREQFPSESRCIDRYMKLLQTVRAFMQMPGHPLKAMRKIAPGLELAPSLFRPWKAFLDSCSHNPRLRAVLSAHQGIYTLPPSKVSTVMHVGAVLHYLRGGFYPEGGGQVIANRLVDAIEEHGGKVLLRAKASRVLVEGGRVVGVRIESPHLGIRRLRAPVVLSNADLKRTMLELVTETDVSPKTVQRVRGYEMAPALGVVYLGIKRDLRREGYRNSNIWIYPSYDTEPVYSDIARGVFAAKCPVFISSATLKDPLNPRVAPPGCSNIELMSVCPSQPESWGVTRQQVDDLSYRNSSAYLDIKATFAQRIIASVEVALPGLSSQIDFQEVASPLTHQRYLLSTGGTSYGIAATPGQFLHRRPGHETEIEGLYLCGASTREGHGISGAAMSGVGAAAAIAGKSVMAEVFGLTAARPRVEASRIAGKSVMAEVFGSANRV